MMLMMLLMQTKQIGMSMQIHTHSHTMTNFHMQMNLIHIHKSHQPKATQAHVHTDICLLVWKFNTQLFQQEEWTQNNWMRNLFWFVFYSYRNGSCERVRVSVCEQITFAIRQTNTTNQKQLNLNSKPVQIFISNIHADWYEK